jgi:hypothetical protein
MAGAFKFNEVNSEDIPNQDHGPNCPKIEPLSIRQLNDILAMVFDDSDFVLRNGYLTKGEPLAICGAPSVGKSRIVLQLIIAIITGRDFLGRWSTNGKAARFLLLQTENTCRRLKATFMLCARPYLRKKGNSSMTTSLFTPSKTATTVSSTCAM